MPTVTANFVLPVEALQPASPPLVLVSYGDEANQVAPIAVQVEEVELTKELDREAFIRHHPQVSYYELDRVTTPQDDLYGEVAVAGHALYKVPILIPLLLQFEPPKQMLKKFGIEGEQDAIAVMSNSWIEKFAPALRPSPGDRISYFNQNFTGSFSQVGGLPDGTVTHLADANMMFEVLTVKHTDYFGSTQIPLHRVLTLKNLQKPEPHGA